MAQDVRGDADDVDESALRYFAEEGDLDRLNAEIARLKALYPGWEPPDDPLSISGGGDPWEDNLWRLLGEREYALVRDQIVEYRAEDPTWRPSPELLERLNAGEIRTRLVNASDLQQFEMVVTVASDHPELLTCEDTDLLWRVAQAFAQTDREERSVDAYRYILENCDGQQERFATMQKAMVELRRPVMVDLLSLERETSAGIGEFEGIRDELARQAVAEGNSDDHIRVSAGDLKRVASLFDDRQRVDDALLLGWYHLKRENISEAAEWFERAAHVEETEVGAQGLALTKIAQGNFTQAELVLAPWKGSSESARSVYLAAAANLLAGDPPPKVDEAVLQRIVPEVVKAKDAGTARQLGWYARAFGQDETALKWFEAALNWDPEDEPSAYGLALTYANLGKSDGLGALKSNWRNRSERIASVGLPPRNTAISGDQVPKVTDCTGYVSPSTLSPSRALALGWCLLDSERSVDAAQAFKRALQSASAKTRSDAAYGLSLAYIRSGFVDQAAAAATQAKQTPERSNELMASILSERATAAYNRRRYREALQILDHRSGFAPEEVGLMVIRGYSYYNLKQYWRAEQVFSAAAKAGNPDAMQGLKLAHEGRRKKP
ncbi:hypothetical protein [Amaricoccus macauensis]|uniref:hypothetical protein n=1 Tax=Amaricoccus macauensis TaxID=57001 RepID=UPI003C7E2460